MENPRFHDDEPVSMVFPDDEIACKSCDQRLKGGDRYKRANCKAYPAPGCKPIAVLFHNDDCDYYERDPKYEQERE